MRGFLRCKRQQFHICKSRQCICNDYPLTSHAPTVYLIHILIELQYIIRHTLSLNRSVVQRLIRNVCNIIRLGLREDQLPSWHGLLFDRSSLHSWASNYTVISVLGNNFLTVGELSSVEEVPTNGRSHPDSIDSF